MTSLFSGRVTKNENNPRLIAHLDMDAFFAAIEERDRPEFKGKPIVIGADPRGGNGRGVVSTANYEARKFGIHSAMPISEAWRLAEDEKKKGGSETIFLAGNHKKYSVVSSRIMEILRKFAASVEEASIDEAYIDLSTCRNFEAAKEVVGEIKERIFQKEKLTASVGLSSNKLISKIASDFNKPNGLTIVKPDEVEKFLEPLPIRKIPGIGPKTEEKLSALGIKKIKDLKRFTEDDLVEIFGKWGSNLFLRARGIDNSPLVENWEAKSIGEQETFENDTLDSVFLMEQIELVAKNVFGRLKTSGFKGFKTVVLVIRFSDFSTKSHSHTFPVGEEKEDSLVFWATKLFLPFLDKRENPKHLAIRLIGVRVEKLI